MIGYLHGKIKFIFDDDCIVDVGGVGYKVFIDRRTRSELKINSEIEFFIYTAVREDSITLYGFKNQSDYELFLQLITVNGIGAKTALNIISKISSKDFSLAIHQKNVNLLTSLPGVGKKSAQRMILELKDKLSKNSTDNDEWSPVESENNSFDEASEALTALGYTNSEIAEVFQKADRSSTTEDLIKFALKELNRF